uniref:Uncharacterized protein n=1 Tax=Globodera rostochiensis TaxID=31243 RepID=A0A914I6I3_GLORO
MEQIAQQPQHKIRQKKRKKLGKHPKTENDNVGLLPEPREGPSSSSTPSLPPPYPSSPPATTTIHHLLVSKSPYRHRYHHHHDHPHPSSPPFSSLSSSFLGPSLPRFHFALVLLSLCIISVTIICAFGCYFRILNEQRRNRRQRRQPNACRGDSSSNIAEKERLARVNKFIVRSSNGTTSTLTNGPTSTSRVQQQPMGANAYPQRIVPKITITSSGSECDGAAIFGHLSATRSPKAQPLEKEIGRKNDEILAETAVDDSGGAAVGRMRPEEFIQTMLEKVERERGVG